MNKVRKLSSGCWLWEGSHQEKGYGFFAVNQKVQIAHRVAYEMFKGPIPEGLTIDHLCRNRRCVNPDHLEAVSIRTNTLRGEAVSAKNLRKTHCIRGHPLSGDNVYRDPKRGVRNCRECRRIVKRDLYWQNPEKYREMTRTYKQRK